MGNVQRSLIKNFSTIAAYRYSSFIINFVSSMIVARLINPEEFGVFVLISIVPNLALMFLDSGITSATIRTDKGDLYIEKIHFFMIIIGLFLSLIVAVLAYPVSLFYNERSFMWPAILISSTIFFQAITVVPQAKLSKDLRFNKVGLGILMRAILTSSITIVLAYFSFSYYALIIPLIIAPLIQYWFYNRSTRLRFKIVRWSTFKKVYLSLKSLIINISGFTFFNYWARNLDKLLAGKIYGEANAGTYNKAYSLLTLPLSMLTGVFNTVQLPTFVNLLNQQDKINEEYSNSLKLLSLIVCPISTILLFFPEEITLLFWGKDWIKVSSFLSMIAILLPLQTISSTSGEMFVLQKQEKRLASIGIVNALILIAFIFAGSFFSLEKILIYYTFSFIFINFPVLIFFGFYKTFKFSASQIFSSILIVWIILITLFLSSIFSPENVKYIAYVYVIYNVISIKHILRNIKNK